MPVTRYSMVIQIVAPEGADPEYAFEEIVGSIMDAEDSEELGGCQVYWSNLEKEGE